LRERAGVRVSLEISEKVGRNAIQIFVHVIVPIAHDAIAEAVERSRSRSVAFGRMLAAVDFDR
jgi:ABC-type molybdate transport system permease subunit